MLPFVRSLFALRDEVMIYFVLTLSGTVAQYIRKHYVCVCVKNKIKNKMIYQVRFIVKANRHI